MNDIINNRELLDTFITEVIEHINSLESNIVKLTNNKDDRDLINEIFRSFHTIKGSSHYLNLIDLVNITHNTENLVDKIRRNELKVNEKIIDILLESLDIIKLLIDNFMKNKKGDIKELDIFFNRLKEFLPELQLKKIEETEKEDINKEEKSNKEIYIKYLIFKLRDTLFAVKADGVIEIISPKPISKLPFVEEEIIGLINFRGELVPVIDLLYKMDNLKNHLENNKIIIVEYNKEKVGIIIDDVLEIVNINKKNIASKEEFEINIKEEWIEGVFLYKESIVILLDKKEVLKRRIKNG